MITLVLGTRPEAIKLAPVSRALRSAGISHTLVGLRQHPRLLTDTLAEFGLTVDVWVGKEPRDGIAAFVGAALADLSAVLAGEHLTVVQGDTSTALAGVLAAHAARVPVAHVEAGLRTDDPWEPWPEEWNRRLIDHGSELRFAPTARALAQLVSEGLRGELTGNTGIDALLWARDLGASGPPLFEEPGILVSLHRREAWGERLEAAVRAVGTLADEWPVVFLHHPSPAVEAASAPLRRHQGVRFCEPQGYRETVRALSACRLVLTDSGGFQEEGPALGKPVLVVRDRTERPELMDCGLGEIVGYDPGRIVEAVRRWMRGPEELEPRFPFGDGKASGRIAESIAKFLADR